MVIDKSKKKAKEVLTTWNISKKFQLDREQIQVH